MSWQKCKLEISGAAPLLMHRLDPVALIKNDSDPRKGTPEWQEWVSNEWRRTAYWRENGDDTGFLYIPGSAIEGSVRDAGKGDKINKVAAMKVIQSAFYADGLEFPLKTETPIETLDDIDNAGWVMTHAVRIRSDRVARRRVMIPTPWKCTVHCMVETGIISKTKFESLVERAGDLVGILDWRPKYGRFTVRVVW